MLTLDLPGHGESPERESYDPADVAEVVADVVREAGLAVPVMVGHSAAAAVVTIYASQYPSRGVINVDQSLRVDRVAGVIRELAAPMAGPDYAAVWGTVLSGMQIELLSESAQRLVRSTSRPRRQVVLGYWRWLLERSDEQLRSLIGDTLAVLRERRLPYALVMGRDPDPGYRAWLADVLPQAEISVLPDSGHFPQLRHPPGWRRSWPPPADGADRVTCLAAAARSPRDVTGERRWTPARTRTGSKPQVPLPVAREASARCGIHASDAGCTSFWFSFGEGQRPGRSLSTAMKEALTGRRL